MSKPPNREPLECVAFNLLLISTVIAMFAHLLWGSAGSLYNGLPPIHLVETETKYAQAAE